jgi:hypothetical protein
LRQSREASSYAASRGERLLRLDEALWFESHWNDEDLKPWRKSVSFTWYWTASVVSYNRYDAWQFSGYYGYVSSNNRNNNDGVRCVGGP